MAGSDVEEIKGKSRGLRGTINEGLFSEEPGFGRDDVQLLKFHGIYQQKIRDKDLPPEQKIHTMMLRGRIPGGRLTATQYAAWDDLATKFGGGSLRVTTRQALQLHGVLKQDLPAVMQTIASVDLTTLGACGDVVRNVTQAVNPWGAKELNLLDEPAQLLSDHFKYTSRAYTEIWLNGEKQELSEELVQAGQAKNEENQSTKGGSGVSGEPVDSVDPIYGTQYLPRKFKMSVTLAGNNSVDIYTNDFAAAATLNEAGDSIEGWYIFGGGGLGMTHNKPETFPRAADLLGWVPADKLIAAAEALVGIHRDYGDRENRKHARLKYVFADCGLEWVRAEAEKRMGFSFDLRELPEWNTPSYLGWQERTDGSLALGLHVMAGRLRNQDGHEIRTAVREIVDQFELSVQLTADQDLVLLGIQKENKSDIEAMLDHYKVPWTSKARLFDKALACPALPTCGLAITEAERTVVSLLDEINEVLKKHAVDHKAPVVRMTGCPNGCARPYAAEIGIVGQMRDKYAIFLGGHPEGIRVGKLWQQKVPLGDIPSVLEPVIAEWAASGSDQQSFGEWYAVNKSA